VHLQLERFLFVHDKDRFLGFLKNCPALARSDLDGTSR
jgi:hypothetical protein